MDQAPRIPARGGGTRVRHFNGTTRKTSDWDGLRRDDQLWSDNENCLVYFYNHGASQRGASLRIPFSAVKGLKSAYLISQCLRKSSFASHVDDGRKQTYIHIRNESGPEAAQYELYIPAPPGFSREQAFAYHLTTRNVLAYAMGLPLVGERLSIALVGVWKRFQQWKVPIRLTDFTTYLEKQGYLDFADNTEHSLACLKLGEEARLRKLWLESFVHCVGMRERLDLSPEFAGINKTTAALIMRASLEMDLHIGRVVKAVGSFLEDELSAEHVGLSKGLRDHLDHFRSFLNSFYVNRLGYFPPRTTTPWNKRPWASMHHDFQNLYDYLADTSSTPDWKNSPSLTGGFCVVQNVQSFDLRHGYPALPHPVPLLPQKAAKSKSSGKAIRSIGLTRSNAVHAASSAAAKDAFAAASNALGAELARCQLVQEFQRFEREPRSSKEKLDVAEARKVRWLLVYGVLQMLNSVIRAPPEVRDTETPSYALCALTSGCPPWQEEEEASLQAKPVSDKQASGEKILIPHTRPGLQPKTPAKVSIRPDCEANSAEDYFASKKLARRDSIRSQVSSVTPITPITPAKRPASIRSSILSSVSNLQKSVGGLSRRNSHRSTPSAESGRRTSFCEIVVEQYDDGRIRPEEAASPKPIYLAKGAAPTPVKGGMDGFDFGFGATPTHTISKHSALRDILPPSSPVDTVASPCESHSSRSSGKSSDSSRSSYVAEEVDTPGTEVSSWDTEIARRYSDTSVSSAHVEPLVPKKQVAYQPTNPNSGKQASAKEVNGGTYVPKGMENSTSKRGRGRRSSLDTNASSEYPDDSVQAAEIDELVRRGRQRVRALDKLTSYGIVLGENNVW